MNSFRDIQTIEPPKRTQIAEVKAESPNAFRCKKCRKLCIWQKHKETQKPAPIEVEPSANGNIFISGEYYRLATKEEIEKARTIGKPLYLNHFASCEFAQDFKKEKPKAAKPECINCQLPLNVYENAEYCPLGCKQK